MVKHHENKRINNAHGKKNPNDYFFRKIERVFLFFYFSNFCFCFVTLNMERNHFKQFNFWIFKL